MNKSLFNIKEDAIRLYQQLEETGGELTPELETALAISKNELVDKSVSYVGLIKSIDGETEIVKNELKRIQAIIKRNDTIVSHLKDNLKNAMLAYDIDEIASPLIKINFRSSKSLEITDIEKLPYNCIILEKKPISKTELKARIEEGEVIPGCRIVENLNLQIK